MHQNSGHTVIVAAVPELNDFVRARTAYYDSSFISPDPGFINAHITVLGPWLPHPRHEDLTRAADIILGFESFTAELRDVEQFADGLICSVPEPRSRFSELTEALAGGFAQCPPYGGTFDTPVPHLTLDHTAGGADLAWLQSHMAGVIPTMIRVDHLDLQWWANDDCRLLHQWPLRPAQG